MNAKIRSLFFICLGLLFGMSVMYVYNNFIKENTASASNTTVEYGKVNDVESSSLQQSVDQLTAEKTVINYVKQNHQLPNYYITKNEATESSRGKSQIY